MEISTSAEANHVCHKIGRIFTLVSLMSKVGDQNPNGLHMYLRATHTRIPSIIYVAMAFRGNTRYVILNGMLK